MFLLKIKSYKLTRFYQIVPGELAMTKFCEPSIFFSLVDNFINRRKTRKKTGSVARPTISLQQKNLASADGLVIKQCLYPL